MAKDERLKTALHQLADRLDREDREAGIVGHHRSGRRGNPAPAWYWLERWHRSGTDPDTTSGFVLEMQHLALHVGRVGGIGNVSASSARCP